MSLFVLSWCASMAISPLLSFSVHVLDWLFALFSVSLPSFRFSFLGPVLPSFWVVPLALFVALPGGGWSFLLVFNMVERVFSHVGCLLDPEASVAFVLRICRYDCFSSETKGQTNKRVF